MLSKKDIEGELGKGINIYPLNISNIKGNSINFSIGKFAWSLGSGYITKKDEKWITCTKSSSQNGEKKKISRGKSAIIEENGKKYLILLPHTTTIVETEEVIGVDYYIGGTLHSKVGIVNKGIGDIGTMLGPGFCGHLMISLHNITNEVIVLDVGITFVSIVFYYLKTPDYTNNPHVSGHVDKLSELGITIDSSTRRILTDDWKTSLKGIRDKMIYESTDYITFKKKLKRERLFIVKEYINWQNVLAIFAVVIFFIGALYGANWLDMKQSSNGTWTDRVYTVLISGIIVPIIISLSKKLVKRNN